VPLRFVARLLPVVLLPLAFACATGDGPTAPETPPADPSAQTMGLEDVVLSNLPAPYYHFEYDTAGRVNFVAFASELTRYHVVFDGDRIAEMDNDIPVNHDRLLYTYDDSGRVALVREVDDSGQVFLLLVFRYQGPQLTGVERDRRVTGGYVIDKTMTLSYYPDGNLRELAVHRPAIEGLQDEQSYADTFEQYDDGVNVDGFGLLHDEFFDHLVLLPVQLQRSNPGRVTRTGDGLNYVSDLTYTYDTRHRPLTALGLVTITNTADEGQQIQTSTVYSYYQ
jgi:hypothetical protein